MSARAVRRAARLHALLMVLASPLLAQSPAREVYTRAELDAAGLERLSEVLQWVSGWSATVEGTAWGASLDGIPSGAITRLPLPDVAILVDGQRIALDSHGSLLPDVAPVLATQVDSVVVARAPGLAGGSVATRGAIHVYTRAVPRGLSASARYRNGAETGDPGPYLWTPLATANVDRTGPDVLGLVGYGSGRWDAELSIRYLRQDVTDPRLLDLHGEDHARFVYTRGPSLRLGVRALGGRHDLLLGSINQRADAYFADLGRLTHSWITSSSIGATGTIGAGPASRVTYRLSHANLSSDHSGGPEIAHGRTLSSGSMEWRTPVAGWEAVAAVGADRWRIEARRADAPPARTQGSLSLGAERRSPDGGAHRVAGSLARVGSRVADRLTASSEWAAGGGRRVHLAGSSSRVLTHEPYRADAWLLADRRLAAAGEGRFLRGEAGIAQSFARAGSAEAVAMLGVLRARGDERGTSGLEGTRLGVRLGTTFGDSLLSARVVYESLASLDATDEPEHAAALVPAHTLRAIVRYALAPTFRIAATARLRSAVRWDPAFAPLGATGELDAVTRLDLSAEKWLWQRRLRARFVIRNALDTPEIHHPAGADFGLRYFLTLSMGVPADR